MQIKTLLLMSGFLGRVNMNDVFKKYDKIYIVGHQSGENKGILDHGKDIVTITEKLDGGNGRFMLVEDKIRFGSRTQEFQDLKAGQFQKMVTYILDTIKDWGFELNSNYIYYVEYMKKHTLNYDWEQTPLAIGFDIWHKKLGHYISTPEKEFNRIGLPFVPILFQGKSGELHKSTLEELLKTKSVYGDFPVEGIVIKNYNRKNERGRQMFAKLVNDDFKEQSKVAFNSFKTHSEDTQAIVNKFCNKARVMKSIHKLRSIYGRKLPGMELMHQLPREVSLDILQEEMITLYDRKYKEINLHLFRKLVSSYCANILKNYLLEEGLK